MVCSLFCRSVRDDLNYCLKGLISLKRLILSNHNLNSVRFTKFLLFISICLKISIVSEKVRFLFRDYKNR